MKYTSAQLEEMCRELILQLQNNVSITEIYLNCLDSLSQKYPKEPDIWEALSKAGDLAEAEFARVQSSKAAALLVPDEEDPHAH